MMLRFWAMYLLTYSIQKFQAMAVMRNMPAAATLETANQALAPSLCMAGPATGKSREPLVCFVKQQG